MEIDNNRILKLTYSQVIDENYLNDNAKNIIENNEYVKYKNYFILPCEVIAENNILCLRLKFIIYDKNLKISNVVNSSQIYKRVYNKYERINFEINSIDIIEYNNNNYVKILKEDSNEQIISLIKTETNSIMCYDDFDEYNMYGCVCGLCLDDLDFIDTRSHNNDKLQYCINLYDINLKPLYKNIKINNQFNNYLILDKLYDYDRHYYYSILYDFVNKKEIILSENECEIKHIVDNYINVVDNSKNDNTFVDLNDITKQRSFCRIRGHFVDTDKKIYFFGDGLGTSHNFDRFEYVIDENFNDVLVYDKIAHIKNTNMFVVKKNNLCFIVDINNNLILDLDSNYEYDFLNWKLLCNTDIFNNIIFANKNTLSIYINVNDLLKKQKEIHNLNKLYNE